MKDKTCKNLKVGKMELSNISNGEDDRFRQIACIKCGNVKVITERTYLGEGLYCKLCGKITEQINLGSIDYPKVSEIYGTTNNKEEINVQIDVPIDVPGAERYTVKSAIETVRNNARTNIVLICHMENMTMEQKLYLAYFYGTREGKPTILDL